MPEVEVLDGNQPAVVDAQAFGQAMARELASFLKADAPKEVQKNHIGEAVQALRAKGLDDDSILNYVTAAQAAAEQSKADLEAKTKETTKSFLQYQTQKELNSSISRITRSYSKDDELVAEVSSALRDFAKEQFLNGTTADIVSARNKFLNGGELDEDVIDDIIAKKIQRIHDKGGGKKGTPAPSGVKNDSNAKPSDEDKNAPTNVESMSEIQRVVYNAHKSTLRNTYGNSKEGLAELEKAALAAAARIKK